MRIFSFITVLYLILLGFVISSCDKEDIPDVPKESKRTVLMYLVGKSNLSKALMDDFNEIKKGFELYPNDEDINLIVFISNNGKYHTPTLLRLKKEKNTHSIIEEEIMTYSKGEDPENSIDPDVMERIMLDAFLAYPAQSYGLVMSSHADGWLPFPEIQMRSFGVEVEDNGKSIKSINIVDLALVLERVTKKMGSKLDYLLFDACLMQSVEVAYELRHSVNFLIGSPAEIPVAGGAYDIMAPALFDLTSGFNINIVNSFFCNYADEYNGLAISSINTEYLEEFAELTQTILLNSLEVNQEVSIGDEADFPSYDGARTDKHYFERSFYHDIYSLMGLIVEEKDIHLLAKWKDLYDKMVYYKHTDYVYSDLSGNSISMEKTHGVSCYIPRKGYEIMTTYYKQYQWYEVGGWKDLGW